MKLIFIPAIAFSFTLELVGRVLYEISNVLMGAAIIILSAISRKTD